MRNSEAKQNIREQMASVRSEMQSTAKRIVSQTRKLRDWHSYVDAAPLACAAAAFAIGYLIVPSRPRVTIADAESLAKLARREQLAVTRKPKRGTAGATAGLLGWVGSALLRQLVRQAVSHMTSHERER